MCEEIKLERKMICRTCLEDVPSDKCLQFPSSDNGKEDKILQMLNICIPELDLFTATEPLLCNKCIKQLEGAYAFRIRCLQIEDEMINFLSSAADTTKSPYVKVDLNSFKTYLEVNNKAIKIEVIDESAIKTEDNVENTPEIYTQVKIEKQDFDYVDEKEFVDVKSTEFLLENVPSLVQNHTMEIKSETIENKPKTLVTSGKYLKKDLCTGCINRSSEPCFHSKVNNGVFICNQCEALYTDISAIRKHIYKHTLPQSCKICGKRSRDLQSHKTHLMTHTDKKPFICDICEKSFKQKFALTQHRRIHDPKDLNKCSYCEQVCSSKYNLKVHMTKHTGKQFQCEYCLKSFLTNSNKKVHQEKACLYFGVT